MFQEVAAGCRERGELTFREVAARALELGLPLIVPWGCSAGGLQFRQAPIQREWPESTIERLAGNPLLLRIRPDSDSQPVTELILNLLPRV